MIAAHMIGFMESIYYLLRHLVISAPTLPAKQRRGTRCYRRQRRNDAHSQLVAPVIEYDGNF
jgi:hypothetical protein